MHNMTLLFAYIPSFTYELDIFITLNNTQYSFRFKNWNNLTSDKNENILTLIDHSFLQVEMCKTNKTMSNNMQDSS